MVKNNVNVEGSLVAGARTYLMWRSGVSGVRTSAPAYIIHLLQPTELSSQGHHKSLLVSVNVNVSWLEEATHVLHCKIGKTSFKYLGLPIGDNSRRLTLCNPAGSNKIIKLEDS
ncbi:hypothetical protein MTR_1g029370 [Medicago truncatula]|uniref:Uncharacterized protein n=1 Tax=Medicago truncatula TaxID=3880 RepID=A0A072VFA8_MEDTR|nr:hypothetical protein MTR_1g029370 [Medicago truncatula]